MTTFSDFSFRVLIYLAARDRPVSLTEIAEAYGISRNHLIKAVNVLEKNGWVRTKRGVGGGISLAREPDQIGLADVFRCTEPSLVLVECFDEEKNTCKIAGACRLQRILGKALDAFMGELAQYTLKDIVGNSRVLLKLLEIR